MNRRSYRIVASVSAATIVGLVGMEAVAAPASAHLAVPRLAAFNLLPQTDPPGPCTPEEIGQTKRGPDGTLYECVPMEAPERNQYGDEAQDGDGMPEQDSGGLHQDNSSDSAADELAGPALEALPAVTLVSTAAITKTNDCWNTSVCFLNIGSDVPAGRIAIDLNACCGNDYRLSWSVTYEGPGGPTEACRGIAGSRVLPASFVCDLSTGGPHTLTARAAAGHDGKYVTLAARYG